MNTTPTSDSEQYGIKFTIPDGPPEQQLRMVKSLRETMLTFAEIAGEPLDTTPFDEVIKKLENDTSESYHTGGGS